MPLSPQVGLLLCDHVRPEFLHIGGDYPAYFAALLTNSEVVSYDLTAGEFPKRHDERQVWITSGSRFSVYDEVEWIEEFAALVRRFDGAGTKLVGICFGAQMMAHALGGRVDRAEQGWQVGVKIAQPVGDSGPLGAEPFRIIHSNADQIVELPQGMRQIATSATNPIEAVAVGEHFLGLQGHPEFTVEYAAALMDARRGTLIPDDVVDEGMASLAPPPSRARLSTILNQFILA